MSCSDMKLVQGLGDCVQGTEVQGTSRTSGLEEHSYKKKDPLQGILDFGN